MCLEDVRIGEATGGGQSTVTVGTASVSAASANKMRRSIMFCPPLAGTITVSLAGVAVAGEGIVLVAGGSPQLIELEKQGQIVNKPWTAIADAGGRVLTVIESFFDGLQPNTTI